jgi:dTDP-4-amino-4,6-dideoxygalactose transaminase
MPNNNEKLMIPFTNVVNSYHKIQPEIDQAVHRVLESGSYILGNEVKIFEIEFAKYCGVKYCIGVNSGLDALSLVLRAWGIGSGDEVIVPAHTFIATWLAVSHTGATPVPVDIDEKTYNIDPSLIEKAITSKTKAIIPVHLYGQIADMRTINDIASNNGLKVLEDAAQSHGAELKGVKAGNFCNAAAFSFYPTKNLGAFGDGGAITTNDENLVNKLRSLRNYGSAKKYFHDDIGYNSRLDDIQAAVLRIKLKHLDKWNHKRRKVAKYYYENLNNLNIELPFWSGGNEHVFHLFVIQANERKELIKRLEKNGISTLIHYPLPPYKQPCYSNLSKQSFPNTDILYHKIFSIPMHPYIRIREIEYICNIIND